MLPYHFLFGGEGMFKIDKNLSISCTRGDAATFFVAANVNDIPYVFRTGDEVRFTVVEKKDYTNVVLQKSVIVAEETERVEISLTGEETKIGEPISKPVDYWYEIELNPQTKPQTIVGYDENGAKEFKLYPESEVGV